MDNLIFSEGNFSLVEESKFFIITGAPGTGKSSLLGALHKKGYVVAEEAARPLIKELFGNSLAPASWTSAEREELSRQIIAYNMCALDKVKDAKGVVFFDRSPWDTLAYDRYLNVDTPKETLELIKGCKFNKKVFFAPLWEEIFTNDAVRKRSFERVEEISAAIEVVYHENGYELITLPKVSVEERAQFVVGHLPLEDRK
ncbi:MAG: hypothetical protein S4CHLAM102_00340 [Chlamydiia bacterium]|nr:hypothetical protein [Chlamydiia bacterium]